MAKTRIQRVARLLEQGNYSPPFSSHLGYNLPERESLESRLDSYFFDRGGFDGLPKPIQKDLNWLLDRLYAGDSSGGASTKAIVAGATESLVIADGSRPVFFINSDSLVAKGGPNGPFVDALTASSAAIASASLSVGRIETDDLASPPDADVYYVGTAFLIAPNLAMTNRHVIQEMVRVGDETGDGPFRLAFDYWLNFDGQASGGKGRRVAISRVLYGGEGFIDRDGDVARLDMALLELGPPESVNFVKPTPLQLSSRRPSKGSKVAVIGYPARPASVGDGETPSAGQELQSVLVKVFDDRFGFKRCAVGQYTAVPAGLSADAMGRVVGHDASTLGGNSGSPLIELEAGQSLVSALHFLGEPRKSNYAPSMDKLAQVLSNFHVGLV